MGLRILRVYHGGRDPGHRARERALVAAGLDVTLLVPDRWPGGSSERKLSQEPFRVVELDVRRPGDVNRHVFADVAALRRVLGEIRPDILDVHEEPFSLAAKQVLATVPEDLPVVMYTAQNIDKRYPPPFAQYERRAHQRVEALYPCSSQAASVARGKGFRGPIDVLPLGYDETAFFPGAQRADTEELVLLFVGRLVPEKGVLDTLDVLARVHAVRPARLRIVGEGPEACAVARRAADLNLTDNVELCGWRSQIELGDLYRRAHAVLVTSRTSPAWVEQFGRVVVEAQACGAVVGGYLTGAIPEVAGAESVLVEEGDATRLADKLLDALADEREHARRLAAGYAQAAQCTWTRVTERQAALYERALSLDWVEAELVPSAASRRSAAVLEFGPTAITPAGARPFALPLLRNSRAVAPLLGRLLDQLGEWKARHRPA